MEGKVIVLFDGECVLCSKMVQFIIKRDPRGIVRFASLQSEHADRLLQQCLGTARNKLPDSLVVIDRGRVYTHSAAALRIARCLRGAWRLAYMLIVVPKPLRDAVYRYIARHRYQWFGKVDACPLPDANMRSRLWSGNDAG